MNNAFAPKLALVLHTTEDVDARSWQERGSRVLSLHKIIEGERGPLLDAGRLLSAAEAKNLGEMLLRPESARAINTVTLLPDNILHFSHASLTWYHPAHRAHLHWRTQKGHETFEAVLPGLVFHVREGVLHVAAFEGDARPNGRTELYHAPLGNVYADSRICTGNATLPRSMEAGSIKEWEFILLGTNFTHVNHDQALSGGATTEQLVAFWSKRKRYTTPPTRKLLAPMHTTLEAWLGKLAEVAP